jgi:2-dehydropantoate 2-reductase
MGCCCERLKQLRERTFPASLTRRRSAFRQDDAILLTMKTQDTVAALERLRAAGAAGQPIFCVQNGVANERFALRRFPEVHGVTVMMPADLSAPGEVSVFSTPRHGIFRPRALSAWPQSS